MPVPDSRLTTHDFPHLHIRKKRRHKHKRRGQQHQVNASLLFRAIATIAGGDHKIIFYCPAQVQCRNQNIGTLGPYPGYKIEEEKKNRHDEMEITGLAKIGATGINTTDGNVPGFNEHPRAKTGNNQ